MATVLFFQNLKHFLSYLSINDHPQSSKCRGAKPYSLQLGRLLRVLCGGIESSVLTSVPELAWRPSRTALCVGFRVFVPGGCFHHVAISVCSRLVLRQFVPACGQEPAGFQLAAGGLPTGSRRAHIRGPVGSHKGAGGLAHVSRGAHLIFPFCCSMSDSIFSKSSMTQSGFASDRLSSWALP